MEVYNRICERVRGALWAHHRKLMPERQFYRTLAFVYNNKYEYQIRFDQMICVGVELGGKLEVITTPSGHIKKIRAHPEFEDLSLEARKKLLISAYGKAAHQGRIAMEQAEQKIYAQFLRDLKPIIFGIRDNPEFFIVPEEGMETRNGVVKVSPTLDVHRTIPYEKAASPVKEWEQWKQWESEYLSSPMGKIWSRTLLGKQYLERYVYAPPKGAPGGPPSSKPLEILAPYTQMDEVPLLNRNWQAFLDNKHVAESLWTKSRRGTHLKHYRAQQRAGQQWHRNLPAQ